MHLTVRTPPLKKEEDSFKLPACVCDDNNNPLLYVLCVCVYTVHMCRQINAYVLEGWLHPSYKRIFEEKNPY